MCEKQREHVVAAVYALHNASLSGVPKADAPSLRGNLVHPYPELGFEPGVQHAGKLGAVRIMAVA
jgi:hypothetical protein